MWNSSSYQVFLERWVRRDYSFLMLRRHPVMQQASQWLLQLRPQCSCHPVPSWHSDPSLALSRSPRVEFLSPDSSPGPGSEHACWRGVESPVWGKEGIAQYYIILKKAILSRVSSQTPRAQTSQSLQWLTLAPLCSFWPSEERNFGMTY